MWITQWHPSELLKFITKHCVTKSIHRDFRAYLLFLRIYMTWKRENEKLCTSRFHHLDFLVFPCIIWSSCVNQPNPTTYHSYCYSNDKEQRYQYVADCHIPIYDGRRLSGAVHCICSQTEAGACAGGSSHAANPLPVAVRCRSPQSTRLFVLHPRRSCDSHMVSPPSPNQRESWDRKWLSFKWNWSI